MSYLKWIGAIIGGALGGILGGVIGYGIGAWLANMLSAGTESKIEDEYRTHSTSSEQDGFMYSLMVLAAHIIQADGKIMHSEMEFMRQFLRTNFNEATVTQGNDILLKLFNLRKSCTASQWNSRIMKACFAMRASMAEEHRMQLLAFLCEIAKADGHVDETEVQALRQIAAWLSLSAGMVDQMLSLGQTTLDDAYNVLGLTPNATDAEVKQAYKRLAIQFHPDRVANLGEDVRKAATLKLQKLNEAKEIIYKARGL